MNSRRFIARCLLCLRPKPLHPAQYGADLRTAALQFSAAPDVAAALIVGAHTEAQVLANVSSMQATIPPEFWAELKRQNLIEQNAPTPTIFDNRVQVIQGRGT
jgi:aryl-alcohol dehydrogenase-like predicted oxidoreductase